MPITNGSFETAGAKAYLASGWTETVTTSSGEGAFDYAEFDVADADQDTDTKETFETSWGDAWKDAFDGFYEDLTYAFFDDASAPKDNEDFEDLWGAQPAELVSAAGPYALAHLQTLTVSVDGAPAETITFLNSGFGDIGDARPEEVVRRINELAEGFAAQLYQSKIRLTGVQSGPAHSLQVTGGTANGALGFDTTLTTGTPAGSPFLHQIEFSTAQFNSTLDRFEAFSTEWGTVDLEPDPDDETVRFTLQAADAFTWGSLDLDTDPEDTSGRFELATIVSATANTEDFELAFWDAMETEF